MEMRRWAEASWAFTRAANVRGWGGRIGGLKEEAERRLGEEEGERRGRRRTREEDGRGREKVVEMVERKEWSEGEGFCEVLFSEDL